MFTIFEHYYYFVFLINIFVFTYYRKLFLLSFKYELIYLIEGVAFDHQPWERRNSGHLSLSHHCALVCFSDHYTPFPSPPPL